MRIPPIAFMLIFLVFLNMPQAFASSYKQTIDPDILPMRVLVAHQEAGQPTAVGQALDEIIRALKQKSIEVSTTASITDARDRLASDPSIQCLVVSWDMNGEKDPAGSSDGAVAAMLRELRMRNADIPVFLASETVTADAIPIEVMRLANDFIWMPENAPDFLSGRVLAEVERYRETVLPPMFHKLLAYAQTYSYSWHTPGHNGGAAFLKTPAGWAFQHYFGKPLLRSDLSISVADLGSMLDHSGAMGESEEYIARVFGSHRSYTVTNGSSTSNRIIFTANVARGQLALIDRNCHKSLEHAAIMSGAVPVWMPPTRNRYGIIGPIPPERLAPGAIAGSIAASPLTPMGKSKTPVLGVITNSTYDGLLYDVNRVSDLLGKSVDRMHFDEAWYGYARFNPIYNGRFAMSGDIQDHTPDKPTIFATHSTHKLLAALSQASLIHVRQGRKPLEHARFNEAYMMHATTSPLYPIIASNDVSAAIMDGPGGRDMLADSILEAIKFRQVIAQTQADFTKRNDWFFNCWQPETVHYQGDEIPFANAPQGFLAAEAAPWMLRSGDDWHGFDSLESGYAMLDPIKVTLITPGMKADGTLADTGIPAYVVSRYLAEKGIVAEKTQEFTMLFLFSPGITKGKWGTLLNALLEFKRDYDANAPLTKVLPGLLDDHANYAGMGLKDLCGIMFSTIGELRMPDKLAAAFSSLPEARLIPADAYEQLVLDNVESLTLEEMGQKKGGAVVATGVVPYPPGIPLLMPGENAKALNGPYLSYLKSLEDFDRRFPGFGHDTHGVEEHDGTYRIMCIKTLPDQASQ
ncbi:hypothetical protein LJC46_00510 [Desulfovibrio sp. OttesenSCG-928-G15]|nr:hypothetical protein [Desulfovibrio sp. OttesenSCG-928-G15]